MVYDYTDQIKEFWPTIMLAWDKHSIERPIIECDLDSAKVIAYPSHEYIENLSERDMEPAGNQADAAVDMQRQATTISLMACCNF